MANVFYNKKYTAIIGDIKDSKKIVDRKSVQLKLNKVLQSINNKYEEVIAAKFMITLGDEFQGLLKTCEYVMDIIEEIQREMYPVLLRFGVGIGEITTDINKEMAIGADGPGYYRARAAIEYVKRSEQKNKIQSSDIRIEAEKDKDTLIATLNTILTLMAVIRREWSPRQREIIYEVEKDNCSQAECAERLNIVQSSVQRSLVKGNYYAYKEAKESVNNVLREMKGSSI